MLFQSPFEKWRLNRIGCLNCLYTDKKGGQIKLQLYRPEVNCCCRNGSKVPYFFVKHERTIAALLRSFSMERMNIKGGYSTVKVNSEHT